MSCEACGEHYADVGFSYDGLDFCEGTCADAARATLAEDLAREDAHARGERCALDGCLTGPVCVAPSEGVVTARSTGGGPWVAVRS